jgi:hypothetical protein
MPDGGPPVTERVVEEASIHRSDDRQSSSQSGFDAD